MKTKGTTFNSVLITHRVFITQLQRERNIRILFPKAYFRYPEKHFPVMYMQDGQNLFDHHTAFNRAWGLKKVMDALPLSKQFIIVGIDNGLKHRSSEYVPHNLQKIKMEGAVYIDFIIQELKPMVDKSYRTLPDRDNTMISGSSLGGLISFFAATRYSHIFGKAGIFSPSFWAMSEILEIPPGPPVRMYIVGSETESKGMRFMLQQAYWALKYAGWPESFYSVVIKNRGGHNEVFWGRNFKRMALFLMES